MLQGPGSWPFEVSVFAEMGRRGAAGLRSWGLSLRRGLLPGGLVLSTAKTRPQPPVMTAASAPER